MIPGIFNNISQKLKCLDKLKIPLETIDIIKSFAFYKINSPPYYKIISKTKEPLLDKFIRIKYIPGICNNGHWALGFLSPYPNEYTQLQAINCISCGEYLKTNIQTNIQTNNYLPKCTCYNLISNRYTN